MVEVALYRWRWNGSRTSSLDSWWRRTIERIVLWSLYMPSIRRLTSGHVPSLVRTWTTMRSVGGVRSFVITTDTPIRPIFIQPSVLWTLSTGIMSRSTILIRRLGISHRTRHRTRTLMLWRWWIRCRRITPMRSRIPAMHRPRTVWITRIGRSDTIAWRRLVNVTGL